MNAVTHALTMNGRIHGEVKDPVDSPGEVLRKRIGLLDGAKRYSLSLWLLPKEVPFDKVNLADWPQEYMQAAGSQERMTLEIRRFEDDVPHQYVIGRATDCGSSDSTEVIVWNGCETLVHESEVFDSAEAASIFAAYYASGTIPDDYHLRTLGL